MAYTKIRGALAGVKYGRIENKRHRRELLIYKQWLEDNRENLRDSTSGQLTRLLNRAEGKVGGSGLTIGRVCKSTMYRWGE